MKKTTAIILCFLMLLPVALASCSKSASSGTAPTQSSTGTDYTDVVNKANDFILNETKTCLAIVKSIKELDSDGTKGLNVTMEIPDSVGDDSSESDKELFKLFTVNSIRNEIYPFLDKELAYTGRTVVISLVDTLSGKRLTTVIPSKETAPDFDMNDWEYVYEG